MMNLTYLTARTCCALITVSALCEAYADDSLSPSVVQSKTERLVKVAGFFDTLRVCNKLPLLDPGERGEAHGAEVDEDLKAYYSGERGFTQSMLDDLGSRTNCFLISEDPNEETGLSHRFYFFHLRPDNSVQFLSAYHSVSNEWIKLKSVFAGTNEFPTLEAEFWRWQKVRRAYTNVLNQALVPSLTVDDHPDPTVYSLTRELKQEWLNKKRMGKDMLADIADCHWPHACFVRTDSKYFVCLFCCNKVGQVTLVSVYRREGQNWKRVTVKDRSLL